MTAKNKTRSRTRDTHSCTEKTGEFNAGLYGGFYCTNEATHRIQGEKEYLCPSCAKKAKRKGRRIIEMGEKINPLYNPVNGYGDSVWSMGDLLLYGSLTVCVLFVAGLLLIPDFSFIR